MEITQNKRFTDFDFHEKVMVGIREASFTSCMPVQERVFEHSLQGKDVMVQSQTGSGKTAAFLLPIFEAFAQAKEDQAPIKVMIIAPTRELAVQIQEEAELLGIGLPGIQAGCFYGGVGYVNQEKLLKRGVDIYIGTPGRLMDFGRSGKIDFKTITKVVIDEADRLFDMGFYPDIRSMMNMMRPKSERQTMLFSATLSNRARTLAWEYMSEPVEIEVDPEQITVEEIKQELYHVSKSEKFSLLLRLLSKYAPDNAIIFTNTKVRAVEVSGRLKLNGYNVQFLMGDLPQKKRLQAIGRLKSGEIKFLVATDVAARGLHVDDLEMVINYDIPEDYENYVHRVGRTARAGKSGVAITLACEQFVYGLEAIEEYIGMKIPIAWPDEETVPLVTDASSHISSREFLKEEDFAGSQTARNQGGRSQGGRPQGGRSQGGRSQGSRSQGNRSQGSRGDGDASRSGRSSSRGGQEGAPKRSRPADPVKPGRVGSPAQDQAVKSVSRTAQQIMEAAEKSGPKDPSQRRPPKGRTRVEQTQQASGSPSRKRDQRPVKGGVPVERNETEARKTPDQYTRISALSFDDRVAYYKKQYSQQESGASAPKADDSQSQPGRGNRAPRSKTGAAGDTPLRSSGNRQRQRPPRNEVSAPAQPVEQTHVDTSQEQQPKMKGLLKRLFKKER